MGSLLITQPRKLQDAPHNKIQLLGMDKTSWEPKTKMEIGGKHLEWEIWFQGTFNGFIEAKTTSTNPHIVDLFSHPLGITKNGFPAWRTVRKMQQFMRERPQPLSITKTTSHPWGKLSKQRKTWNETHKKLCLVDVFVTSECIHLYILCIVPRCSYQEVSVIM